MYTGNYKNWGDNEIIYLVTMGSFAESRPGLGALLCCKINLPIL